MRRFILLCFLLLGFLLPLQAQEATIVDILLQSATAEEADFTILLLLIDSADPTILETLSDPSADVTFFAPTDEAIIDYMQANELSLADLIADTNALTMILQYHTLGETVTISELITSDSINPVLLDSSISVSSLRGVARLNNTASVTVDSVAASNGLIHVIDALLIPPTNSEAEATPEATQEG